MKYNYYRAKFNTAPYLPLGFPVHLDLELAGKCQLACTMCPFGEGTFDESKQGMMTKAMAASALREARKNGALSVKLNFRGEPGLSRHLIPMAKRAKELGYTEVMLNTNLTAFSTRRLRELCRYIDLLIVSVDGATAETYESIRIKGDFKKLVSNLMYIKGLTIQPRIRINMTVQDRNRHEVELMKERFGGFGEIVFNPIRSDNSGERKRCPQPFQRLVVMWDGQVGACCSNWNNEAVIGKYPDQSLKEIWQGAKRQELLNYARHPERGGPCKGCLVGGSYK